MLYGENSHQLSFLDYTSIELFNYSSVGLYCYLNERDLFKNNIKLNISNKKVLENDRLVC